MTQASFIEILKLVGSLVGLATGLFVLFDRLVRSRPRVWVEAERVGANAYPILLIRNLDDAPVFVRGITTTSKRYAIARDTSVEGIVRAMTGDRLNALIAPKSDRAFQLIDRNSSSEDALDDGRVRFSIRWRRATSPELWQMPVWVWVRPSAIQDMIESVRRSKADRYGV